MYLGVTSELKEILGEIQKGKIEFGKMGLPISLSHIRCACLYLAIQNNRPGLGDKTL